MVKLNLDIPDDFYKEEIRCEFTVTAERKKVWAVELDMLDKLLKVCKKYNIEIIANGGTTLGAARHKGFIPWDDDIDLMMTRKEYEKLCGVADNEFRYPYFFQTEYTDMGSLRGHAQLRRSDTTGALAWEKTRKDINQGIFIDIFPLDKIPDDPKEYTRWINKLRDYRRCADACVRTYKHKLSKRLLLRKNIRIFYVLSKSCTYWYEKYEKESQKYNESGNSSYGLVTFLLNIDYKKKYPVNIFDSLIELPFEMLKIPVLEQYDEELKIDYGDWHKFVKGGSMHGDVLFNTDRSYTDVLGYGGDKCRQ